MDGLANRSESTRNTYRYDFSRFAEWMGKTPDELFDMALAAQRENGDGDPRDRQVMEQYVKKYLAHIEAEGLSVATQKRRYAAINSFFTINQVPLMLHQGDRPKGDDLGGSKIPSKQQIRGMLDRCVTPEGKIRLQYRALIMTLKDSGLRTSDVVKLRWSAMMDLGDGFWGWDLLTQKRRVRATTIIGPEATVLLTELREARLRDPDLRDEARIFPLNTSTARVKLSAILKDLPDVTVHGLRKYFSVTLLHAGVPEPEVRMLMGKATTPYHENRLEKLAESYIAAYDQLRIYPKVAAQKEVDELQREVAELRQQLAEIQESRRDSDNLMNRLVQDPQFMQLMRKKIRELS